MVKDLKLASFGFQTIAPDVRAFAPQLDGSAVTFWGDPARTASDLRERNAHDADAFVEFDKKMRAIASFLAYINVATPPDAKSPSIADAIMGLKLGKAFRDLGAKTGREAIRALPMAAADLVQEVFEDEAIRGPLATRGVLFTSMGPWATGTAAVFLNDSAGNDGGAAGTAVFARGGTGASAAALERRREGARCRHPHRYPGRRDPVEGRPCAGRHARRRHRDRLVRSWCRAPTPSAPCACATRLSSNPYEVWRAENIRQPGATAKINLALSGLPTFTGAADPSALQGRIVVGLSIDHVEKAMDAVQVRPCRRGPDPGSDDPVVGRPVARARGQARDVDPVPGGATQPARR